MKDNFCIVVESYHIADRGEQENVRKTTYYGYNRVKKKKISRFTTTFSFWFCDIDIFLFVSMHIYIVIVVFVGDC